MTTAMGTRRRDAAMTPDIATVQVTTMDLATATYPRQRGAAPGVR